MSALDCALLAVIAVAVGLAVRKIVRDKRQGKVCSSCGGNCAACQAKRKQTKKQ